MEYHWQTLAIRHARFLLSAISHVEEGFLGLYNLTRSTRRFLRRPSAVEFLATGRPSP
jgi:hypothetical protein